MLAKFILWFLLMNLLDLGLTTINLMIQGPHGELNPVARSFYIEYGFWGLLGLKMLLVPVVALALARLQGPFLTGLMVFGTVAISAGVFSNLLALYSWMGVI